MNMQVFITDRILLSNSSEVTMEARAGGASIPLQLDPPLFALSNSHKQVFVLHWRSFQSGPVAQQQN